MIRDATIDDIPAIVGIIDAFYKEAPYKAPPVNPEKSTYVLAHLVERVGANVFVKVIQSDFAVVGILIAERQPDLWSDAEKVVEIVMYVYPEWRGTASAGRLLIEFARWSQLRPAVVRVEASSGIDDAHAQSVFEKLGWEYRGTIHGMEAY